jgi:hypothetical protein
VRRIGTAERRARLAVRHHLAADARGDHVAEVAGSLVGLHSTDPATVFLAAAARLPDVHVAAIERALYVERAVVRTLGMRRTLFVVPVELAPVVQSAVAQALVPGLRRRLVQLLQQAGVADDADRWLSGVEQATLRALTARGGAFGGELADDVPELRTRLTYAEGKAYGGPQAIGSQVLFLLAAQGCIVRGRPRGSWVSGQYQWVPTTSWLPDVALELPVGTARTELVRRWLAVYGPAPIADLRWWTGWTARDVKAALEPVATVEVELADGPGLVLADDVEPVAAPEPWVALLPALDPTVMGWTARGWYLGEHGPALFDRSGNAGPTIWWDGRVVGGWAQRRDGEIAFRLLEDAGSDALAAVEAEAERLARWLGDARVTPRFRTPLEKELAG